MQLFKKKIIKNSIPFSTIAAPITVPPTVLRSSLFYVSTHILSLHFLMKTILIGTVYTQYIHLMALMCIFLLISNTEYLLAYWLLLMSFVGKKCQFRSIADLNYFSFCCQLQELLKYLVSVLGLYFLPSYRLFFHYIECFPCWLRAFQIHVVPLFIFCFVSLLLVLFKTLYQVFLHFHLEIDCFWPCV